jgi:hypothetical protein
VKWICIPEIGRGRVGASGSTCTSTINDQGVFFDSKLYFHSHVDYVFSECIKLLGLIRSITFRFSSQECLNILYFSQVQVGICLGSFELYHHSAS